MRSIKLRLEIFLGGSSYRAIHSLVRDLQFDGCTAAKLKLRHYVFRKSHLLLTVDQSDLDNSALNADKEEKRFSHRHFGPTESKVDSELDIAHSRNCSLMITFASFYDS